MNVEFLLSAALASATPILLAALGELLTERAGVINLGVEGTLLLGAISGLAVGGATSSVTAGIVAAMLAGALFGALFAFLVIVLRLDQIVTGLVFGILGSGLSSFLGSRFASVPTSVRIPTPHLGALADIPFVGPVLFRQDLLVYVALILVVLIELFIKCTRPGLILRTLGENPKALDALGHSVPLQRAVYVIIGSSLVGLGGAYLSLALTPSWVDGMSAGRGWIAIGLVIFAAWRPGWILVGACLFGAIDAFRFRAQIGGPPLLDPHFLNMTPFIATLVALVLINRSSGGRRRAGAPSALGIPFERERR
jgi:simple sugar transport system permease protein